MVILPNIPSNFDKIIFRFFNNNTTTTTNKLLIISYIYNYT